MSKILVVPHPEFGHILPFIPILKQLSQHEIVVMATSQTSWLPEKHGFQVEYWVRDQPVVESSFVQSGTSFWWEYTQQRRIRIRDAVQSRLDAVAMRHEPDFYIFDSLFPLSYGLDCSQPPYYGRVALVGIILPRWNVTIRRAPSPLLYLCPASFEIPRFVIKHPMVHYVEPSCSTLYDSEEIPLSGKPLVLAAFGTQASLQRSFIERILVINEVASRHHDVEFLIGMGEAQMEVVHRKALSLVDNLALRTRIPQRALLKKASAFITHGGLSSIKEAVMFGVPMIITPEVFDQPFNAIRAEHHSLAESLFPNEWNETSLEKAVLRILDRRYNRTVIESFQQDFMKSNSRPRAAGIIEDYIFNLSR